MKTDVARIVHDWANEKVDERPRTDRASSGDSSVVASRLQIGKTVEQEETENTSNLSRSKKVYFAILLAATLALLHFTVRRFVPSFSVLYDGPERPAWISLAVDAEFLLHLMYLGALLKVTGRSIPGLQKPEYSDEGTGSLFGSNGSSESTDWRTLLTAWAFVPVYVVLWMLAYGYI